ncbi:hypothetical protein T484DRAFT_1766971 [Baffinella frigidus]|nr:hypothetical protein T484DRAFT_1766971 [Cryptophyta sp. CCMP2293]
MFIDFHGNVIAEHAPSYHARLEEGAKIFIDFHGNAKIFIDFHGNVIAEHAPSRASSWDVNKFLLSLRARKLSWSDIYWRVWGLMATMDCSVCGLTFSASELAHCSYCPNAPIFRSGQNAGVYPCCSAPAVRVDTGAANRTRRGCCASNHVIDPANKADVATMAQADVATMAQADVATMAQVAKRQSLICIPFKDAENTDGQGAITWSEEEGGLEDDVADDDGGSEYEDESDTERDGLKGRGRTRTSGFSSGGAVCLPP